MAAIPRRYVDGFTSALNAVSSEVRARMADELARIDMGQDVAEVRRQVVDVMQRYCGGATDMAAQLAAEFYDGLRELELGEPMGAVATSGRDPDATEGAVRAFAQQLVDGSAEAFVRLCLERLDYEVKVAAAQTVLINGRRDRSKPRYARVPTGAETCDFCLMLASRGFVYVTEAAASHAHSGCDCRVVPSWKAHEVEGYEPLDYYDQWQASIDAKASERAGRNGTTYEEERKKIIDAYERASSNAKRRRR